MFGSTFLSLLVLILEFTEQITSAPAPSFGYHELGDPLFRPPGYVEVQDPLASIGEPSAESVVDALRYAGFTLTEGELKVKERPVSDEWMTQLIDSYTKKFSATLRGLHPKPNQIQFVYTWKYLEGLPIVLTKMDGTDLTSTAFSWICNSNKSYMERDQLIQSFKSLITFVIKDHFTMLENLNVDTETIRSRTQMITGWVYDEILNPSIGFPIMGNLRDEAVLRVLRREEPSFRKLNGFLAHYFGQVEPQPSPKALSSILINCWYFSNDSQTEGRLVNDQAHLIALKEQIERNASIPNASYFLSQFLSFPSHSEHQIPDRVQHVHPVGPSNGNVRQQSTNEVDHTISMSRSSLEQNQLPIENFAPGLPKEEWMTQLIDSFTLKFSATLHGLHPKPNQIQFAYTREYLKGLPIVLTRMEALDLTSTGFSWIFNPDKSYMERDQLVQSFKTLITLVITDHCQILENLQVDAETIKTRNQMITGWVYDEILDPPIGYPILGSLRGEVVLRVLRREEPSFRKLNGFLAHYFGQLEPRPSPKALTSILINCWYFSTNSQIGGRIVNDQAHLIALKEQIERNASIPNASYFLSQFLSFPSHSEHQIPDRVQHVHPVGPSNGNVRQQSTNEVDHTISMSRGDLERNQLPIENFAPGLPKEEWMTQLIDSFTLKFSQTLHGLHPKPNQIQFTYTRKYLEGLPIVLTTMEGTDATSTSFSWISNPDKRYMERDQLIESFKSLITLVVTDHCQILENLQVDAETIKTRNQMITGWVYDEILNPPIGYPIMGSLRGEVVLRVLRREEPSFRKLNGFLAHYFGQLEPRPSPKALTSILINCWYFSTNSQIGERLVNNQAHLIALKEQIEENASIPNASNFLSQFLSCPSHPEHRMPKRVKHVHAVGPSKGNIKEKSTNEIATGGMDDSTDRLIYHKVFRDLARITSQPNQIQFAYTRKYLKGLPIVLTRMEALDSTSTAFSWIFNPDESYMERDQLVQSFKTLITLVITDHSQILENLQVDTETIKSRNQMITGWVYDEILNPSIGYPIMGDLRGEVVHRVVYQKEPAFRKLNGFLAHYLGRLEPQPSPRSLTSILINCWYFSKDSQIGAELVNNQAHLIALKDQIEKNASIPNASYFLSKYLSK
ncbi:hypothetical protein KEM48_012327 [Puccinia striiformis f. sp. tritici PST-130]|nr:hypothetical protein KEM48_012327 [Puccinia striiformis f. sp. tritici PST-130]